MSNANSDRTSNDLVRKIAVSIRWDWNVSSVVFIRDSTDTWQICTDVLEKLFWLNQGTVYENKLRIWSAIPYLS